MTGRTPRLDGRPADPGEPEALRRLLARRLGDVFGAEVSVHDLTRLTGGASRETWAFTVSGPDGRRGLILRRDPPGAPRPEGMGREAAAIAAAARVGVAVPPLVDAGTDPAVLGAPYLVTDRVDGETIPRRLLRDPRYADARAGMAAELGRTLARIHALPVDQVPGPPPGDPLAELRESYDALGEPLPTLEVALHWLAGHRPEPVHDTVVHGDLRNGNVIVGEDGLRAVLDWELVHHGDPREDLGWLCVKCWRFGSAEPVGGFGSVEELLDGYAEVAGWRPRPGDVHWWQVYGTARWAVGCRAMAERHLSDETPSVELAAIGRRVCEQEHDLLLALGVPAAPGDEEEPAGPEPAGSETPASDLHGRPTSTELLDAVVGFLREDLMPTVDGRLSFLTRVAANALDGVNRQTTLAPAQERRHRARLAALGLADQAAFAEALRSGALDPSSPDVLAAVRAGVTDRLVVANPRYLAHPGEPEPM